jgi:hypothetical protein
VLFKVLWGGDSSLSIYFNNGRQWTHFLFCALRLLLKKLKQAAAESEKKEEQEKKKKKVFKLILS